MIQTDHQAHTPQLTINLIMRGLLFMYLMSTTMMATAQVEDEAAAAEISNEIICYAAATKWVCAPADDKQKAHDKAMRLKSNQPAESTAINTDNVEITTLNTNNNFNQTVQETQPDDTLTVNQAIQDFTPRDGVSEHKSPTAESNDANEITAQSPPSQELDQNPPAVNSQTNDTSHTNSSNNSTQSSNWQTAYPERWSFQVTGTSNQHHLDDFIVTHQLQNREYTIVKTQVKGAPWWVVLVGLYDSRDEAINNRDQLPAALASQAWVRQLKSIQ